MVTTSNQIQTTNGHDPVETPGATSATLAMSAVRFRIPGDTINKAVSDLPENQRAAIKWFAGYCRSRNLGNDDIAGLLRKENGQTYSYASVYQALTGRRGEAGVNLAPLCTAIEQFRREVEGTYKLGDSGFIETRLSRLMWARFKKAKTRNKITFIFGDSQIGKSVAAVEYQRNNNHGETIYVEAPTGGNIHTFQTELARALGIPTQQRQAELRRRLIDSFDDKMLLIVDEGHRFLKAKYGDRGIQSLDFIRELYNRTRCGIAILMTNEGRDLFKNGPHAKALQQLWNRRIAPLQLPNVPPSDDLALFAQAYGLEPADEEPVEVNMTVIDDTGRERQKKHKDNPLRLQTHVTMTEGLGVWLMILQDAADIAKEARRNISWGAVIKAYCLSKAESEVIV